MSIIAKKNVRLGDDALIDLDPNDIHGDGTNVPVKVNDLAFVITTGDFTSAGYIYKAVVDESLSDSGTRVLEMSSGDIVWKRVLYADKKYNSVPAGKFVKTIDGTIPDGYESFLSYLEAWPLYAESGDDLFLDSYTRGFIYNGHLYGVASDGLYNFMKLNLSTYEGTRLQDIPYSVCKCSFVLGDYLYMFNTDDHYVYDLANEYGWASYIGTGLLADTRGAASAAGKGWVFGASKGEPTMYNKLYRVNSTTSFSQMTPAPTDFGATYISMVGVGNYLYVFANYTNRIEILVYSINSDSWSGLPTLYEYEDPLHDGSTINRYMNTSYHTNNFHYYYDSIRNSIFYKGYMYTRYASDSIRLDLNTGWWYDGWNADLGEYLCVYADAVHDPSTDTVYFTYGDTGLSGGVYWARMEMCGTNLCKKV